MADPKTTKKAQKARSAAAKRSAATRRYNKDTAAADVQRQADVESRPERYKDLAATVVDGARADSALQDRISRAGFDPASEMARHESATRKMSPREVYRSMQWRGASDSPNVMGQQELPGMEHPDALPTPRRWEEFEPHEQDAVRKAVRRFGVTEESAHASLASQIDSANLREGGVHHSFYSVEGESESGANMPRTQVRKTAEREGVRYGVNVMANAITSPNNRFVMRPKSGDRAGQVVYPNDEAAAMAIQWAKEGRKGEEYEKHPDYYVPAEDKVTNARGKLVKRKDDPRKYPAQGYPRNQAKAIDAVSATERGASVAEAWGLDARETGRSSYGSPKTAPFHNSFVDPHGSSQFWVSDTHSGPAAFAPHLRGKQEDQYMSVDGVHAFNDHVARQVMQSRGLNSLSGTQSQHWSEEKHQQGHAEDVQEMQPRKRSQQFDQLMGQQELF
jgi:hypothetical protein